MQHLRLAPPVLVDAVGIAVEHLENWQGLLPGGHLSGHMIGRGVRHDGVETHVILATKGPRIRQRPCRHQIAQFRARAELPHQLRQQLIHRRVLHQAHQRLQRTEIQSARHLFRQRPAQPEFVGQPTAKGGNESSLPDLAQEFAAGTWSSVHRGIDVVNEGGMPVHPPGRIRFIKEFA